MKIFKAIDLQYSRLERAIRSYIQKMLGQEAASYTTSNVFGMIINIIQAIVQNFLLYLEDAVQEQNIKTAVRRDSVFSLAKISGYEPFYGYAASGTLKCNLLPHNNVTSRILIPDKCRVQHVQTGKIYNIVLPLDYYPVNLNKAFSTLEFQIVAGTFMRGEWQASGIPLEEFSVKNNTYYDINYTDVFVNGKKWTRYACLYDMQSGVEGYVLQQAFDGEFSIVFGNDVHGKQLRENDHVTCTYLAHAGEQGNLSISADSEFVFYDSVKDAENKPVDGNSYMKLRIANPVTGGTDADTVEEVRNMTGFNSRALVLASDDNYKLFLSRFSFVGYNNIWTYDNSLVVNINALRKIDMRDATRYYSLRKEDFLLDTDQKEIIKRTLEYSKQMLAGTTVHFVDPVIRNYACILYVGVDPEYTREEVSLHIKETIARYFGNIDGNKTYVAKSDIVKELQNNVKGIDIFSLDFVSEASENAYRDNYYDAYRQVWSNGTLRNKIVRKSYDASEELGLDDFGNIRLRNNLEFPVLLGDFRHYFDKSSPYDANKTEFVKLDAVNIFFVSGDEL